MALVAEQEREAISVRTKAALGAARARGVVLGGYRGGPIVDQRKGVVAAQARAEAFAEDIRPMVLEMSRRGPSLGGIATALMVQGVRMARGGQTWTADGVRSLLMRAAA